MDGLLRQAEVTADRAVLRQHGSWECAYHHASDLLHFKAGLRRTLRCMRDYESSPVEQAVEAVLGWDRDKDGGEL